MRRAPAIVVLFLSAATAVALGGREEEFVAIEDATAGDRVEAEGTIQMVGSQPHTYLSLVVPRGTAEAVTVFRLVGDTEQARGAQGRRMIVRGVLETEAIGPGFPAELRVTEIEPAPNR